MRLGSKVVPCRLPASVTSWQMRVIGPPASGRPEAERQARCVALRLAAASRSVASSPCVSWMHNTWHRLAKASTFRHRRWCIVAPVMRSARQSQARMRMAGGRFVVVAGPSSGTLRARSRLRREVASSLLSLSSPGRRSSSASRRRVVVLLCPPFVLPAGSSASPTSPFCRCRLVAVVLLVSPSLHPACRNHRGSPARRRPSQPARRCATPLVLRLSDRPCDPREVPTAPPLRHALVALEVGHHRLAPW